VDGRELAARLREVLRPGFTIDTVPGVAIEGGVVRLWYGNEADPVLVLRSIALRD
jgi:hypothetical protein